jgi:hypothetical protein
MERGIEESVDSVPSKCRVIFSADGPPPEIALAENKKEQRTENVEDSDTLLFIFAASRQSISE